MDIETAIFRSWVDENGYGPVIDCARPPVLHEGLVVRCRIEIPRYGEVLTEDITLGSDGTWTSELVNSRLQDESQEQYDIPPPEDPGGIEDRW